MSSLVLVFSLDLQINKSSATDMEHPPSPLAMMSPGPDTGAAMASCATASPPGPRRATAPLLAHCEAAPTAEERAGSHELMQVGMVEKTTTNKHILLIIMPFWG